MSRAPATQSCDDAGLAPWAMITWKGGGATLARFHSSVAYRVLYREWEVGNPEDFALLGYFWLHCYEYLNKGIWGQRCGSHMILTPENAI
jgi:hypothetical protein